jgi:hypothetical protein
MKIISFIESLFHIKIDGITIDTIGLTNTKVKNTLSFGTNSVIGFESGYALTGSIAQRRTCSYSSFQ